MTSVDRALDWVSAGRADLPLPAGGRTRERWSALTEMSTEDVSAGRLVEAHADADAILAEIEGGRVAPGEFWGVWAAEPPQPVLAARPTDDGWVLDGVKAWCSGAGACTHALVTARVDDHSRLFAVDLRLPGVGIADGDWVHPGMAGAGTTSVAFEGVPARTVGDPSSYLDRTGFWHGGIGVAACWLGAGIAVARPLLDRTDRAGADPHALAHLGAVDVALGGATWALDAAAREIDDAGPGADATAARHRAVRVRAIVESAVDDVIRRVGRALGAAPLALDARHAQAVLDASVYIRQFHAERDLAGLGATTHAHGGWCRR